MRYLVLAIVGILSTVPTITFAECFSEDDVGAIISLTAESFALKGGEVKVDDRDICELVRDKSDDNIVTECKQKKGKQCSTKGYFCKLYVVESGDNAGARCGCRKKP